MSSSPLHYVYRHLFERLPGVCLIETDASGTFTYFDAGAEAFFNCSKDEALGVLHYRVFHDPAEMETCGNDPAFQSRMALQGWSEEEWTIVPRAGKPFRARVTLMRTPTDPDGGGGGPPGWIALYHRLSAG